MEDSLSVEGRPLLVLLLFRSVDGDFEPDAGEDEEEPDNGGGLVSMRRAKRTSSWRHWNTADSSVCGCCGCCCWR